jgi:hypothetical protein
MSNFNTNGFEATNDMGGVTPNFNASATPFTVYINMDQALKVTDAKNIQANLAKEGKNVSIAQLLGMSTPAKEI